MVESLLIQAVCDADMRITATTEKLIGWYEDQTVEDMTESYELRKAIQERKEGVFNP